VVPLAADLQLALGVGVAVFLITLVRLLARRMPDSQVARRADRELALRDRLSTALAFAEGGDQLVLRQRADAAAVAAGIDARGAVPVRLDRRRLAVAAALALAIGVLVLAPNPQHEQLAVRRAVQLAALQQAEMIEQLRSELRDEQSLAADEQAKLVKASLIS
jgi:hypothetical protein